MLKIEKTTQAKLKNVEILLEKQDFELVDYNVNEYRIEKRYILNSSRGYEVILVFDFKNNSFEIIQTMS